jgi:hypothetical protein
MRTHDPTCLDGPLSGNRDWWRKDEPTPAPAEPLFRAGLVEEIRREIAAGTYDTPERWEAALDRLLDRLEKNES